MCWTSYHNPEIHKAEKDISCYKIVNRNLTSFYYTDFPYKLNEIHITELDAPKFNTFNFIISKGFHSYSPNQCKIEYYKRKNKPGLYIGSIYTIYSKKAILDSLPANDTVILECVIPKDSLYYINEHGEIVSNRIKPLKVIKEECVGLENLNYKQL